jgi:hypothetical protein
MIVQQQHRMLKLFDHVIPVSMRTDAVQWQAARHLSILAGVTALSVPLLTLMYHLLGYDAVGMVVLTAGVVMMVTPFMLAGVGVAVARDVFISALFLLKIWMAVYLGGVNAPTTSWFVLCPAVALLIGGLRPGLVWSALVLAAVVVLFALGQAGLLPAAPGGPGMPILGFASVVGLLALIVLIMALAVGAVASDRRGKS